MYFGIREYVMGVIINVLVVYGLFVFFCVIFFVFSDYLMFSMRLSVLMKLKVFFIFMYDSIGVGEDGVMY